MVSEVEGTGIHFVLLPPRTAFLSISSLLNSLIDKLDLSASFFGLGSLGI